MVQASYKMANNKKGFIVRNVSVLILLSLTLFACKTEPKVDPAAAEGFVKTWSEGVEENLLAQAGGGLVSKELEAVLTASADAEKAGETTHPPYAQLVHDAYNGSEFKPVFLKKGKLSPRGALAWKAIQNVPNYGLASSQYHIKEISDGLKEMQTLATDDVESSLKPTETEIAEVLTWAKDQAAKDLPLNESSYTQLQAHLMEGEAGKRLKRSIESLQSNAEQVGKKSATIEARMAIDLAQLSHKMRFQTQQKIFVHPRQDDAKYEMGTTSKRTVEEKGKVRGGYTWRQARARAEEMVKWPELQKDGIRNSLTQLLTEKDPKKAIQSVLSSHPQHAKMVAALTKYRKIVKEGGWKEVKEEKGLRKGSKGKVVSDLKARLKIEGFFPVKSEVSENFGKELDTAVRDYQETHQMDTNGIAHKTFWKSLNVPAEKRMKQIAINLDRIRKSNIRHDKDKLYVYVNVPDFHAEVWENQERKMRFRVVVGNNGRVLDQETKKWERANRTPTPLAALIDRVIYNPYWNVTQRVRTGEIILKVNKALTVEWEAAKAKAAAEGKDPSTVSHPYLNKDTGAIDASVTKKGSVPSWYAQHGYEVVGAGRGYEYVRQVPGGGNALGKVKVIFPNLHDVYLHDTPKKALFKKPVRAFSHGCMRMHNPLDFAEFLLRHDKLYEENDIPKLLKKRSPSPIFLKEMVPVFVEYVSVRVDDKERVHFLADIYDYDDEPIGKIKLAVK